MIKVHFETLEGHVLSNCTRQTACFLNLLLRVAIVAFLCTLVRAAITLYGPYLFMCLSILLNCEFFEGRDGMWFSSASLVLYLEQSLACRGFDVRMNQWNDSGHTDVDKGLSRVWSKWVVLGNAFWILREHSLNVWTGWYWRSSMMASPVFL